MWQRPAGSARDLIEHLSVGGGRQPASAPACAAVHALADKASKEGGVLRYLARPLNVVYTPAEHAFPHAWFKDPADNSYLRLVGQGRVQGALYVPADGRYELWIEGSDARRYRVAIDGREVADPKMELNSRGVSQPVAALQLSRGRHEITLVRGGGNLLAGNGGVNRLLGPVALSPVDPGGLPVREVPASAWRTLCGRSVDWIDAVQPAS